MKKRLFSLCLCCAMLLTLLSASVIGVRADAAVAPNTDWYNETETSFTLGTAADLLGFAKLLSEGNSFAGKTLKLSADIDLNPGYTGEEAQPATVWQDVSGKAFSGVFDGQGHSISGLYMTAATEFAGFFGYAVGGSAEAPVTVKNLGILNSFLKTEKSAVGSVFGKTDANAVVTVDSVYADVTILSTFNGQWSGKLGGIIGSTDTGATLTISGCAFVGSILSTSDIRPAGGILGYGIDATITISNCAGYGSVTTGGNNISAIIGRAQGGSPITVTGCVALGESKGAKWVSDTKWVGSLVGGVVTTMCTISNSVYADAFYSPADRPAGEDYVRVDLPYGVNTDSPINKPTVNDLVHLDYEELAYWVGSTAQKKLTDAGITSGWTTVESGYPLPTGIANLPAVTPNVPIEPTAYDISWYEGHEADAAYELTDAADLLGFSYLLSTDVTFEGKTVTLGADINLNPGYTGGMIVPANKWYGTAGKAFSGVFDGKGHVLSGIYMEAGTNSGTGLFGNAAGGTAEAPVTVKNVAIVDSAIVTSQANVGGIFGAVNNGAAALIDGVYVSVQFTLNVTGEMDTGGLIGRVGEAAVTVSNSAFAGAINATVDARNVGGLIGKISGAAVAAVTIENCACYGDVKTGGNRIGGFVGYYYKGASLVIDHCVFMGDVKPAVWAVDTKWVGAFVGRYDVVEMAIKNSIYKSVTKGNGETMDNPYGVGESNWKPANEIANLTYIADDKIAAWIGTAVEADLTTAGITGWETLETAAPLPKQIVAFSPDYVASYTVTWDVNGTITTETYKEGETPVYPGEGTPTRAEDEEYSYVFHGWDQELSPVTGDVTYTAKWLQVKKPAKTTDDGTGTSTGEVPGGDDTGTGTEPKDTTDAPATTEPDGEKPAAGCSSDIAGLSCVLLLCAAAVLISGLTKKKEH